MTSRPDQLASLDPFDILDAEAARLDRHFSSLDGDAWNRQSRCAGWTVRDVLAHLAGEELYNHACLDRDVDGFYEMLEHEGVRGGYEEFNEWCVRRRRRLPVEQVLDEWRGKNAQTRSRMRELGRDGSLATAVGPYPAGLQAFHYSSEFATHADDVGVPVTDDEASGRLGWRTRVGLFALDERGSQATVEPADNGGLRVWVDGRSTVLSPQDFVDATVGRLPAGHPIDPRVSGALRCLA
ncbi:maleylpyruvate isomerase family mycothiol-dependent enzyme [Microbispora sp. RL4-1S]|uniref:Maleylpyruvate isomerase family mycothiol-dependent enzyme n=1 Tax=Microbispora oryzae TaxID=2806554 RepID=A0A941AQC3_9ACTN|nr:maleylpyruvate isomerase family mycothiol-dependent enzyme [Microbispora oryzae]MBP2704564.1 maleylpyruvate isomerase family mycothiol-dependent enzyme [Microbispora oryzae]